MSRIMASSVDLSRALNALNRAGFEVDKIALEDYGDGGYEMGTTDARTLNLFEKTGALIIRCTPSEAD